MPTNNTRLEYYTDKNNMVQTVATWLEQQIEKTLEQQALFTLVLAGGSAPIALYKELATRHIDWSRCHLFLGDDRCVPFDDARSNVKMIRENLLDLLPQQTNFYTGTEDANPKERAHSYALALKKVLGATAQIDVSLLGVGPDGHTASLFPHFDVLKEKSLWVLPTPVATLDPFVERITLTYPLLNQSKHVIFFSGIKNKESIFATLQQDLALKQASYPFQKIEATHGLRYCVHFD